MIDRIIEHIWPPTYIRRLERELDAREREGMVRMAIETWEFQKRNALREYHKPMFCAQFFEETKGD